LTDVTGGQLSVATDTTDSFGVARTFYTGGVTPSSPDGVSIRAWTLAPDNVTQIEDTTLLTVAGVARDVTIGTGNTLIEIPDSLFAKEWVVIVKDGVGNPVPNSNVQVRLLPTRYAEGTYSLPTLAEAALGFEGWQRRLSLTPEESCLNEDPNYTGNIADPGVVDENGNGKIDPGTDAVVAAVDPNAAAGSACSLEGYSTGTAAADVTTNANGLARVCVYYTEDYATWLEVNIEARTNVSGTEFSANNVHWLPMSADDQRDEGTPPANINNPYGNQATCAMPDILP